MYKVYIVILTAIFTDDFHVSDWFFDTREEAEKYSEIMIEIHDDEPCNVRIAEIQSYSRIE